MAASRIMNTIRAQWREGWDEVPSLMVCLCIAIPAYTSIIIGNIREAYHPTKRRYFDQPKGCIYNIDPKRPLVKMFSEVAIDIKVKSLKVFKLNEYANESTLVRPNDPELQLEKLRFGEN